MTAGAFVEVLGLGMATPVGLTSASVAAAVRAGISRIRETPFWDLRFRPHLGAYIPEEALPSLPEPTLQGVLAAREQRLLRLARPALHEAMHRCERPPPLLLALPEEVEMQSGRKPTPLLASLRHYSGVELNLERSQCFARGRAGGMFALKEALRLLSEGRVQEVLVGGVDSFMDPVVLATLEAEGRLRRHGPSDGLTPGEGAAFLHLGVPGMGRRRKLAVLARVMGVGTGWEPGHRYSQEPYLGEGLAEAFHTLFAGVPTGASPIRCVYAGFNGESFWAKEWGVAYLRTRERFVDEPRVEHPAENVGDVGAASGPLMIGLASMGLHKGYREGPLLVWCSSDREERGAVLIHAVEQER
jgi:3-oxoacyl-[acyl-carrier-protein] synthase-1